MNENALKLLSELAKMDITTDEVLDIFSNLKEEISEKNAIHDQWLEELADAREDFIQSFFYYIEILLNEDGDVSFKVDPEDEKYLKDKIQELESNLIIQQDKINKATEKITNAFKDMEKKNTCNCNKSKKEGGNQVSDDELIKTWMHSIGLL